MGGIDLKKKQIAITLGIMCLLLTIAISVQIKTMNSASSTVSQTLADNGLRDEVLRMKERYDNAYSDLQEAQKQLEQVRQEATQDDNTAKAQEAELKENNMILGYTDVVGDGVEVILQDAETTNLSLDVSTQLIHYDDLQNVINELKNAGAEAIEINGQRLTSNTAITCEGNVIKVNGERVGSPFTIRAIGPQELLYGSLRRAGSYLDLIRAGGNRADITKVDDITIARYAGVSDVKYLKEDK